jgi:hypothetical protein
MRKAARAARCRVLAAPMAMRHDRAKWKETPPIRTGDREKLMRKLVFAAVSLLALSITATRAEDKPPLKIGGILDMSSLYADITGAGSLEAAKMAAEDAGGEVLGRKIEPPARPTPPP